MTKCHIRRNVYVTGSFVTSIRLVSESELDYNIFFFKLKYLIENFNNTMTKLKPLKN